MIGIINYNIGNLLSVTNALDYSNIKYIVSSDPKKFTEFEKIILIGVGSFPAGMQNLKKMGFDKMIKAHVNKDGYLLGICLGMQLLMSYGYEIKKMNGLNLVKGEVTPMKSSKIYKIPHIGWNNINFKKEFDIFNNIKNDSNFYFVHSYKINLKEDIDYSLTKYGNNKIVSAFKKNKIFGVQFHPEKSQNNGIKLLKNFANI